MRQRLLLDRNWRFALGHAGNGLQDFDFGRSRCLVKAGEVRGAAGLKFDDEMWQIVNVPHDWAIDLPLDSNGDKELGEHGFRAVGPDHPANSVGWYRRSFEIPKSDLGKRICVEFDGVFRDAVVWINGHRLGRHQSGYTSFQYDLTDMIVYGGRNVLAVRVDVTSWEGWWYEGAGIYRHVWLVKTDPVHIAHWGTVVTTELGKSAANVTERTKILNDGEIAAKCELISEILDPSGKVVAKEKSKTVLLESGEHIKFKQKFTVKKPHLWSCETPNLYMLRSTVKVKGKVVDETTTTFGIRTLRWDVNRGFFLNGKSVKIKGTCNHQQHAGVGIAMPDRLQDLRIEKLKEMGSNAYRCSHYAATPELLDACDRHGILVMAENRLAGSTPEVLQQFESMIVRDRNHPSIILWSLANEEHTVQWSIAGERIGRTMVNLAHRLDPTRNVTAAMHDRGLNEGFANIVDVHGWNYIKMGNLEAFHKRRPEQPIIGSEEASTVCTRGIYADDAAKGYVSAYDTGSPPWGCTAETWWPYFAERPWLAGAFVWTGFDYFGEPIPYLWPCTASHFGLMDLCGFPKDNYYYYQAWWSDRTVLHLFPHWNWTGREGESIDVRCFSNCEEVELLLNGTSLGRKKMKTNSHLAWPVPFQPGRLEAHGYTAGKKIATSVRETTGPAASIVLTVDRKKILADGEDLAEITVTATDAKGRLVPTSDATIQLEITGPGRLLGTGNGDPSSHDSMKTPHFRLFNGMGVALIQSMPSTGEIGVRATSPGLSGASVAVKSGPRRLRPAVS